MVSPEEIWIHSERKLAELLLLDALTKIYAFGGWLNKAVCLNFEIQSHLSWSFSALLVLLYVFYQVPVYSATNLSNEYFKCSVHTQKELSQVVWKYVTPGSVMYISTLLTQANLILLGKRTQTREYAHGHCHSFTLPFGCSWEAPARKSSHPARLD